MCMGWSTTVVSPPDGDMADYMRSLEKLLLRDDETYYPTHGAPVTNPKRLVRGLLTHRRQREYQILALLNEGLRDIPALVERSEEPTSELQSLMRISYAVLC